MNTRLFYLDAMRGSLMMLGVVLHSAQVYSPTQQWLIYSSDTSPVALFLVEVVHTFRMPAFFVVSGYFCLLTLRKYGVPLFLRLRLKRIVIPLLVTGLTINSAQALLLDGTGWANLSLQSYFLNGGWVSHLWFLNYLIVFFLCACALFSLADKTASFRMRLKTRYPHLEPRNFPFPILLMTLPLYTIALKIVGKLGLPLYWDLAGIIQGFNLLFYLQFFLFGMWMNRYPKVLQHCISTSALKLITILIAAYVASAVCSGDGNLAEIVIEEYLKMLVVWVSVILCFNFFYAVGSKPTLYFRRLSDASYTVYLFHHILVILGALILRRVDWPPLLELTLLMSIALIVSILVHTMLIQKFDSLSYAFNGKAIR
ncbi:acyltransferase family protein [Allohahella marinimesophila]|uniref:Glucans biosynthesis protein MdoC n=1 Tax=Allohahella marinimesophila TaxID=1054972 RepID=A0ABP7QB07_9GAMM